MSIEYSNPNNPELITNLEQAEISEQALISILSLGAEKPQAQSMLQSFCEQEEKKVELLNTKEASINFNMRLGLIYVKAGYIEEGIFSLECALEQAWNDRLEELYNKISTEIDNIKESS